MMRCLVLFLCLLATLESAPAEERVTALATQLSVNTDATIDIVESIEVNVEGKDIKRGIIRTLSTTGGRGIDVKSVRRNGKPETFEILHGSTSISVKIGNADVFLEHGLHRYEIVMLASDALAFEEPLPGLSWDVTGYNWSMPIDHAEVSLQLPDGAKVENYLAAAGNDPSAGAGVETISNRGGLFHVRTTRRMAPGEGFVISVWFTPGIVVPRKGI